MLDPRVAARDSSARPTGHGIAFVPGYGSMSDEAQDPRPSAAPVEMRFHHVGVAVHDLAASLELYTELFGFRQVTPPIEVPSQRVRVCFVEADPGVLLELVEGLSERSPISRLLERSGAGPYHVCYEVADLDESIRRLRERGCKRLRRFEQPAYGLRRFAFLLSPDGQLFELCEPEDAR